MISSTVPSIESLLSASLEAIVMPLRKLRKIQGFYFIDIVVTISAGLLGFVFGILFMNTVIGTLVPAGAVEGIRMLICQTSTSDGANPE